MPRVTDQTKRYIVERLRMNEKGEMECTAYYASSFQHIAELDNHNHPLHYYRNICIYQQEDGTWKGRSKRARQPRFMFIRRIGFTQVPGRPLRGSARSGGVPAEGVAETPA